MPNSPTARIVRATAHVALGVSALAIISGLPKSASAQTAPVTISVAREFSYPDNEAIVSLGNSYSIYPLTGTDLYAGAESVTVTSGGGGLLPTTFPSYCIDLTSDIKSSESSQVTPLNSSFNLGVHAIDPTVNTGGALAWLYNNNAAAIIPANEAVAQQSAALQLALWEVEYNWTGVGTVGVDNTLATGNFQYHGSPGGVTSAIVMDASAILTKWNGQVDTAQYIQGVPGSVQALIAPPAPPTPPGSVPEPGALALALGPILGLVCPRFLRRRR